MLLCALTFTHVFTGVLLSLQNWQASIKSREEKEEEKSNIGSQGCAAASGRQPKIYLKIFTQSLILKVTPVEFLKSKET